MNPVPRVSVNMAVYNTASYLPEAIESILSQTYTNFEFIIIDDGSTDCSRDIVQKYAEQDSRIRFVSRPNKGVAVTRSEGLSLSRGEFYAVMDSDDISLPSRLEREVAFLDDTPECVCVGTSVLLIDSDGDPIGPMHNPLSHDEIDRAHMSGYAGVVAHATSVIRIDALRHVGGYRPEFCEVAEDFDMFLRLAEHGRLANLPDLLYLYRMHDNSLCHRSSRHMENKLRALQDAHVRRGIRNEIVDLPNEQMFTQRKQSDVYRGRSWMALEAGYIQTARKYAFRALLSDPREFASYGLLHRVLVRAFSEKMRGAASDTHRIALL